MGFFFEPNENQIKCFTKVYLPFFQVPQAMTIAMRRTFRVWRSFETRERRPAGPAWDSVGRGDGQFGLKHRCLAVPWTLPRSSGTRPGRSDLFIGIGSSNCSTTSRVRGARDDTITPPINVSVRWQLDCDTYLRGDRVPRRASRRTGPAPWYFFSFNGLFSLNIT